jgi:flagellin
MSISIRTNVSSLEAQRNLSSAQNSVDSSMRKLASGYRITRGADDAAGLAISEKLRAQVTGTQQAIRNSQDGISMLQTMEGGLSEVGNIVQRMRELGVQAGNGTLNAADHKAIAKELVQLKSEIGSIAGRTTFNGHTLINGTSAGNGKSSQITLQVGSNTDDNNDTLVVDIDDFSMDKGATSATSTGELKYLSSAIKHFASAVGALSTTPYDPATLGAGSAQVMVASAQNVAAGSTKTSTSAAATIVGAADIALDKINLKRADIGAKQNRLEHNIAVQQIQSDNLAAAQSRIQDVDVAIESAKMSKSNILQQAAVSVLSQANQAPQLALKLLG